jgi:hydrogenase maturation protease
VRVVCRQQWTPELAEEIAVAEAVLFIDCSAASVPGSVSITAVGPASTTRGPGSHHQGAAELLALARGLYNSLPRTALLLTVGAASLELGEEYSEPVSQALPEACRQAEAAVLRLLG